MLRTIFVVLIILFGTFYAVQSPFYFLLFYLWYAYFRPDVWIYWLSWVKDLNLSLYLGTGLLITTALSLPALRINMVAGLMAAFLLHTVVTAFLSLHPTASWASWWEFLRVWLVSYTIILLVTDLKRFRLALLVIAVSLGFEAAKQGWVGFMMNPGGTNNNELPFLGDNNGVAVGMMMLVPVFGALAQTSSRRWERVAYWMFGAGVFLRGLMTYSRGGFLSALVVGAAYWLQSRRKVRVLITTAVMATLVLSVMPQQFWDRMQTITAPPEQRDGSAQGRLYFWGVAMQMAAANPITGVGFDGFHAAYDSYDDSRGRFGDERDVHSTWFGVLADTGYVGFALFASLYLATLGSLLRVGRRRPKDERPPGGDASVYAAALVTALLAFGVGGSFVTLQYNEMFWHFVALGVTLRLMPVCAPAAERVVALTAEPDVAMKVRGFGVAEVAAPYQPMPIGFSRADPHPGRD